MQTKERYYSLISVAAAILLLVIGGLGVSSITDINVQSQLFDNRHCIVIDAGHGGVDGGAVSCTGVAESQINLEIALRLNDLCQLLGLKTKMIRTEDISIYTSGNTIAAKKISDLKERIRIINNTDNAVLLSIHQNYFSDSKYSGAQVFYGEMNDDLASTLQSSLVKALNTANKRKAKRADNVYLMKNIHCPAALIECGFLSNPIEEQKLRNAEYQKKLCCIIGATVSCYIQNLTTA